MPHDDPASQIKKLRSKERLLGVALAVIPLAATILFLFFAQDVKDNLGRHLLGAMAIIEWLILVVIYLIVVSNMRKRRR